ncbi:MAG: hypothetical protein B7Z24_01875 [Pseudomonadales bacterium 32-42-5]|nr:MAG: hypothetical protein B7Z24_01875 [Pseudomonadales bacterium 32-42-5]
MQNSLHLLSAEELMVNMRDSLIQKYNVPGPRSQIRWWCEGANPPDRPEGSRSLAQTDRCSRC